MAVSTVTKNWTAGSVTLRDGTSSPVSLALDFDNGDFSISGLAKSLREVSKYERRGSFQTAALAARTYPTGSFTAQMTQFSEASGTGTIADFILQQAAYSANVSTLGSGTALPYTIDIVFAVEGTNFGDSADHTFTLTDCRTTFDFSEGDPNAYSISFEVLGAVSGDLAAS